jgi:hypothetical protein
MSAFVFGKSSRASAKNVASDWIDQSDCRMRSSSMFCMSASRTPRNTFSSASFFTASFAPERSAIAKASVSSDFGDTCPGIPGTSAGFQFSSTIEGDDEPLTMTPRISSTGHVTHQPRTHDERP